MVRFSHLAVVCVAVLVATAGQVQAGVIISNLQGNDLLFTSLNARSGGSNGGSLFNSKAAGFTMPGGDSLLLDSVTLRLKFYNLSSVPVVQLFDDLAGNPNSSLFAFDNPAFAVGTANYDFTPASDFLLTPNDTFWIVVSNNAAVANSYRWLASSPGIAPSGTATNAGYRFDIVVIPPTTPSSTLNKYAVTASATTSAVPEPSSLALFGIGACVAGVGAARRRRREKHQEATA